MDYSSIANIDVSTLSSADVDDLLAEIERLEKQERYGKYHTYFPDTGPFRRELYAKHMEFFAAGSKFTERLFIAANRVGKTEAGAFEGTADLTGDYKHWWEGRFFKRPVRMWAAGDYNETTRDVIQKAMLGSVEWHGEKKGVDGTGMIPREKILMDTISWKAGVPDLIDTLRVDHHNLSGTPDGTSLLGFKSYMQGRRAFQGTEQDIIWCDEEPDIDVYGEMLIRLMTAGGLAMLTFTPLSGRSDVVKAFSGEDERELD